MGTWILGKIVYKRVHTEKDEKKNGQFGEGSLITLITHEFTTDNIDLISNKAYFSKF